MPLLFTNEDISQKEAGAVAGFWVPEAEDEVAVGERGSNAEEVRYVLPYQVPGGDDQCVAPSGRGPAYAKATCTAAPGRVVCRLGRYMFVINNGEHRMAPEVIERFAAMLYHRTLEGDSNFDISVEAPSQDESFSPDSEETVLSRSCAMADPPDAAPVFVECNPVRDERRLCQPPFSPAEVVYSCRRHGLGLGKRAVIAVDPSGRVSDGRLVLPYRIGKRSVESPVTEGAKLVTENKVAAEGEKVLQVQSAGDPQAQANNPPSAAQPSEAGLAPAAEKVNVSAAAEVEKQSGEAVGVSGGGNASDNSAATAGSSNFSGRGENDQLSPVKVDKLVEPMSSESSLAHSIFEHIKAGIMPPMRNVGFRGQANLNKDNFNIEMSQPKLESVSSDGVKRTDKLAAAEEASNITGKLEGIENRAVNTNGAVFPPSVMYSDSNKGKEYSFIYAKNDDTANIDFQKGVGKAGKEEPSNVPEKIQVVENKGEAEKSPAKLNESPAQPDAGGKMPEQSGVQVKMAGAASDKMMDEMAQRGSAPEVAPSNAAAEGNSPAQGDSAQNSQNIIIQVTNISPKPMPLVAAESVDVKSNFDSNSGGSGNDQQPGLESKVPANINPSNGATGDASKMEGTANAIVKEEEGMNLKVDANANVTNAAEGTLVGQEKPAAVGLNMPIEAVGKTLETAPSLSKAADSFQIMPEVSNTRAEAQSSGNVSKNDDTSSSLGMFSRMSSNDLGRNEAVADNNQVQLGGSVGCSLKFDDLKKTMEADFKSYKMGGNLADKKSKTVQSSASLIHAVEQANNSDIWANAVKKPGEIFPLPLPSGQMMDNKAAFLTRLESVPAVRDFTDTCKQVATGFNWCPQTELTTDCPVELCVTLCPAGPPEKWQGPGSGASRMRRGESLARLQWPLAKRLITQLNAPVFSGIRKRQATGSGSTTPCSPPVTLPSECPAAGAQTSVTCPPPPTTCGPVPDPPGEVPACVSITSRPSNCCQTTTAACPAGNRPGQ